MYGKLIKLNANHMPNFMSNFSEPTCSANTWTFSRSFFSVIFFKIIEWIYLACNKEWRSCIIVMCRRNVRRLLRLFKRHLLRTCLFEQVHIWNSFVQILHETDLYNRFWYNIRLFWLAQIPSLHPCPFINVHVSFDGIRYVTRVCL